MVLARCPANLPGRRNQLPKGDANLLARRLWSGGVGVFRGGKLELGDGDLAHMACGPLIGRGLMVYVVAIAGARLGPAHPAAPGLVGQNPRKVERPPVNGPVGLLSYRQLPLLDVKIAKLVKDVAEIGVEAPFPRHRRGHLQQAAAGHLHEVLLGAKRVRAQKRVVGQKAVGLTRIQILGPKVRGQGKHRFDPHEAREVERPSHPAALLFLPAREAQPKRPLQSLVGIDAANGRMPPCHQRPPPAMSLRRRDSSRSVQHE